MMHPYQGPPVPYGGAGGPPPMPPRGPTGGRPLLPPSPGQQPPPPMGPPGSPFPSSQFPDQHPFDPALGAHMQRAAAAARFGDPNIDPTGQSPYPLDDFDDFDDFDDHHPNTGYADMPPLSPAGSFGYRPGGGAGGAGGFGGGPRPPSAYPYQGPQGGPAFGGGQQQPWPFPGQGMSSFPGQRPELAGAGLSPRMDGGFPGMGQRGPQPRAPVADQNFTPFPRGGANFGQGQGYPFPGDRLSSSQQYFPGDDFGDNMPRDMGAAAGPMGDGGFSDNVMGDRNVIGMFNFGKSLYPDEAHMEDLMRSQTTGSRGLFNDDGDGNGTVLPPPMGYRGGPPMPAPMSGGGGGGGSGGDPRMMLGGGGVGVGGGGGGGVGYGDPRMMAGGGVPVPRMRQPIMPYLSDRPHQVAVNARFVHQNELLLSGESWITSVPLFTRGSELWALALGANDKLNRMDLKPTGTILVATAGNENMVSMRLSDPIWKAWTPIRRFFVFLVFPKPDGDSGEGPMADTGVGESPKSGSGTSGGSGNGSRPQRPRHVSFLVDESDNNGGGSEFAAPSAGVY